MRTFTKISVAFVALAAPLAAFALEGIGPRVTVTGTVLEVNISSAQAFQEYGGEVIVKATNGQIVTLILNKDTEFLSEGRLSRKLLTHANITVGMDVRVRGWRIDEKSLNANLFIIANITKNPALATSGVVQKIDGKAITILSQDGVTRSFSITNETEVNVSYTLYGADAVSFVGKQALLTLNPQDATQARIIRITEYKVTR